MDSHRIVYRGALGLLVIGSIIGLGRYLARTHTYRIVSDYDPQFHFT